MTEYEQARVRDMAVGLSPDERKIVLEELDRDRKDRVREFLGTMCDHYCKYPALSKDVVDLNWTCDQCQIANGLAVIFEME